VSSDADEFQFRPLTAPRYTQIPDVLIDEWAPHLSPAELRVVLYVARRTFGFHKERDAISLSQLCNGITAHDGRRLDYGTGLSRKGVISACASLSMKGLLSISKQRTPDGDNEINIYTLIVRAMGVVTAGNHPSKPRQSLGSIFRHYRWPTLGRASSLIAIGPPVINTFSVGARLLRVGHVRRPREAPP